MSSSSASPSPVKRPTLTDRPSSANSLSSSVKQNPQRSQRHHVVGANRAHVRTTSYGKALGKAGKINSVQNLAEDGSRHHSKKSSGSIPSTSPKNPALKRNSSHVALPKNSSHVSLRKNKSANAIGRNLSHTQLQKKAGLGHAAAKPRRDTFRKHKGFELGDKSSDEEADEEAEWEDSTTQSPKLTRDNSAGSLQAEPATTSARPVQENPSKPSYNHKPSSPPGASLRQNRSAPDFGARASSASPERSPDRPTEFARLHNNPRSSRAPPAISSISAQASRDPLPRNNSSFTHISHADTNSSHNNTHLLNTPNTGKSAGGSSSADGAVSHFLSSKPTTNLRHQRRTSSSSDYDSPSSFLPNYHPQESTSPEKVRVTGRVASSTSTSTILKSKQHRSSAHLPSRTQQRLELQRRETMRAAAPTTPSTPLNGDGHGGSSAVSLNSRSGSQGRNRGTTADPASAIAARLMIKQDYDAAERQLAVVRRFRNPIVEAVGRLKEAGLLLGWEKGGLASAGLDGGVRDKDRRKKAVGRRPLAGNRNTKSEPSLVGGGVGGTGATAGKSPLEEMDAQNRPSADQPRPSSRGRASRSAYPSTNDSGGGGGGKVHLRRQGSHDDIGLSRSQGSYDGEGADGEQGCEIGGGEVGVGDGRGEGGLSAEEEMIRRMWESRDIYDRGVGR